MDRSDAELLEVARKAVQLPPDFVYGGSLPIGKTWGFSPFSLSRDDGILARSNFERISAELTEDYPDEAVIERARHFGTGWIDHLYVRVFEDKRRTRVTDVFRRAMEIQDSLDENPGEPWDSIDYETAVEREDRKRLENSWTVEVDQDLRDIVEEEVGTVDPDWFMEKLESALANAGISWGGEIGPPTEDDWKKAILRAWPEAYQKWFLEQTDWTSLAEEAMLHIPVKYLDDQEDREFLASFLWEVLLDHGLEIPVGEIEYVVADTRLRDLSTRHIDERRKIAEFVGREIAAKL